MEHNVLLEAKMHEFPTLKTLIRMTTLTMEGKTLIWCNLMAITKGELSTDEPPSRFWFVYGTRNPTSVSDTRKKNKILQNTCLIALGRPLGSVSPEAKHVISIPPREYEATTSTDRIPGNPLAKQPGSYQYFGADVFMVGSSPKNKDDA